MASPLHNYRLIMISEVLNLILLLTIKYILMKKGVNSYKYEPYIQIIDFRAKVDEINSYIADMGLDNLFESQIGMAIFINLCEEARNLCKNGPHKTRNLKIVLAVS